MLPQRIKEVRKTLNMNQRQFAEFLHVTQGAISQWETGRTRPDTDQLIAMASAAAVPVDYLLGNDTPEPPPPPPPSEIDNAIAGLADGLSLEEVQRVLDFIAGIKAARKG